MILSWLTSSVLLHWQRDGLTFPTMNCYQPDIVLRCDRKNKGGGGILLAVKNSIKTVPFNFTSKSLELVSVVINCLPKRVLVCVCYRPPNADTEFLQEFNRFVKSVVDSQLKDIIMISDFNYPSAHWLNGSCFSDSTTDIGPLQCLKLGELQNVSSQQDA